MKDDLFLSGEKTLKAKISRVTPDTNRGIFAI